MKIRPSFILRDSMVISLNIHPPASTFLYCTIMYMADMLGLDDEQAEQFSRDVIRHVGSDDLTDDEIHDQSHDETAISIQCIMPATSGRYALVLQSEGWQERIDLPDTVDQAMIITLQNCLPTLTSADLLQCMCSREQLVIQQRNAWRDKTNQLLVNATTSIEQQSMFDALTGLPNRKLFSERAEQLLQLAARQKLSCTLVMMDIDDFNDINDAIGHQQGDLILQEVVKRLKQNIRATDLLARMGGDEYGLLLYHANAVHAREVVAKLQQHLGQVFEGFSTLFTVTVSVGIAEFPAHGDDYYTILRRADMAMYVAKKHKTTVVCYDPSQEQHQTEHHALLVDLDEAIKTDGLELFYQPQVHMKNNKRISVEALIRWKHPTRGMVFPDQFIPLAEESGLIIPLTWWVLETAARQCATWHQQGLPVNISINITAEFLQEDHVVERICDCIHRHKLPDNVLALEITENTLMVDPAQASNILVEINAMKVDVSIDDFGTGYSSLAYLKYLEIDELKIDRSFIMCMINHANTAVIVKSVIGMAKLMSLRVVAEGVETREEWDLLAEMGCDFIQGYFICRPLPVCEITPWLAHFSRSGLVLEEQG